MLKRRFAVVAVAALMIGFASTSTAFAYEDPAIEVHIDPTTLIGGNSFDGYAISNGVDCNWTVTFRGDTRTDFGTRIDFTFDTPVVDHKIFRDVVVTCSYDDTTVSLGSSTSSTGVRNAGYVVETSASLPTAIQELERAVRITILPRSSDDDDDDGDDDKSSSDLPDTGGVDAGWIYGGVALLLIGSATVVIARRRNESNA